MTKTWQFELNIEPMPFGADISEPRKITTFVYLYRHCLSLNLINY